MVRPLEDCTGDIISQGFLMTEDLNGHISSVFTREDISSLPVPDAKFQETKSDYLGQLIVTPEIVAKKIKAVKDKVASLSTCHLGLWLGWQILLKLLLKYF